MTANELVDEPPAGTDIGWMWAELEPLRDWLKRQAAEMEMPLDVDRIIRQVVNTVEAQRPHIGAIPPQEYLRTLAERIVLQTV